MSQEINSDFPHLSTAAHGSGHIDGDRGLLSMVRSSRRLLVVVFMLVIYAAASRPITDPDFFWHLKTGQYLFETKTLPSVDIFSWPKFGSEWVTHEWLSELLMYVIYKPFGYLGLVAVFSGIITATFAIAYRRCRELAPHPHIAGFALIMGAAATMPTWGVRPQMFSMLVGCIFVLVLGDFYRDRNAQRIWLLVPLTLLWVNLHAGFAMGLAFIVMTIISLITDALLLPDKNLASSWPAIRRLVYLFLACTAIVSLNPSGIRMYLYPFETLTSHAMMQYIQEWKSPNFHEPMFYPLAVLFLVTFAVLALSDKKPRPGELLMLLVTALSTLRSSRNVPFFALVAIPLVARHLWQCVQAQPWGGWFTKPERLEAGSAAVMKVVLNVLILLVIPMTVIAVRLGNSVAKQPSAEAATYPAAAVNFIKKEKPPQPIFNEYVWGGYLIWHLYPDYRVNMDGRADVYGDALVEEFLAVHDGEPKWKEALDRQGIRTVLLKPDVPLASLLRRESNWQNVFEDDSSVIFVRK